MKLTFPFLTKLSENAITGIVFAAIFITGLGVFTLSASVIVSSAFLAISALAAYALARQQGKVSHVDTEKQDEQIERLSLRLKSVEGSMQTVDARILSAGSAIRTQIRNEMAPMLDAIGIIADIVEEERRKAPAALPSAPPALPQPVEPAPFNPLQQLRSETILRETLLTGKLTISTSDIVALPTSRPAYRLMQAHIGRDATAMTEARLRADGVPSHLIWLFDKVRFAHGFEIASHLTLSADSPVLVCPLTIETLSDPLAGQEIADLMARRPGIAKQLCFLVTEDSLFLDTGTAGQTMRELARAGSGFALDIEKDIRVDPASLHVRGVILAMASAELILAARDGKAPTEIHPADLVQLFDRHGIDLAVSSPASERILRAIRSLGINLVMRPKDDSTRAPTVRMRPERPHQSHNIHPMPPRENEKAAELPRAETFPAPLRAHLRRVSA